jgi:hypothetical protein
VVIISLNLLQKGKDNFTSNAYELHGLRISGRRAAVGLETCSYVKFKTTKKIFFRVVVENEVMATSRKYSTELMVQKIVEITKYGRAEILDFSNNNFAFEDWYSTNNKRSLKPETFCSINEKKSADGWL